MSHAQWELSNALYAWRQVSGAMRRASTPPSRWSDTLALALERHDAVVRGLK